MICPKCDVLMDAMGYGDEKCPKCKKVYWSDVSYDEDGNEIEEESE